MSSRKPPQTRLQILDQQRTTAALKVAQILDDRTTALKGLFPLILGHVSFPTLADDVFALLPDPYVTALLLPDPARRLIQEGISLFQHRSP